MVLGATNRPEELDEAVLRRLPKRILVPLPDAATRAALLSHLLRGPQFRLPAADLDRLVQRTEGYSGSDLAALAREAAMEPLRELPPERIATVQASKARVAFSTASFHPFCDPGSTLWRWRGLPAKADDAQRRMASFVHHSRCPSPAYIRR